MSSATTNLKTPPSIQTPTATSAHLYPATVIGTTMKALKYQHIAPAPPGHSSDGNKALVRKYTHHTTTPRTAAHNNNTMPYSVDQTQSVQRRNARERNRVKQVNNSFVRLRQHIPQSIITDLTKGGGRGPHKKISKVDTLRIAVEYIRRLQDVVDDLNVSEMESSSFSGGSFSQASDTASNSSFSSHSSSSSMNSSTALDVQSSLYYSDASPIGGGDGDGGGDGLVMETLAKHKDVQTPAKPQYATSGLLTPVSLSSYSPQRPIAASQQQQQHHDSGCQSPTSSFNSSMSSYDAASAYEQPTSLTQLSPPHHNHYANAVNASVHEGIGAAAAATNVHLLHSQTHLNAHLQLKFEPYEHFSLRDDDCTPDDEEILDYISLWQEE